MVCFASGANWQRPDGDNGQLAPCEPSKEGDYPVTEEAGRTSIAVPFHNRAAADKADYVAETLEKAPAERPRG